MGYVLVFSILVNQKISHALLTIASQLPLATWLANGWLAYQHTRAGKASQSTKQKIFTTFDQT
jgi:hypothetical protein